MNIQFLQNQTDIISFLRFIQNQDVSIYTSKGEKIGSDCILDDNCIGKIYYFISKETRIDSQYFFQEIELGLSYIEFCPSFKTGQYWQLGGIFISENTIRSNCKLFALFKKIKKYIKDNYILSDDKMFYAGEAIYNDWLYYKAKFLSLIKFEKIQICCNSFEFCSFCAFLENMGYKIFCNGLDIRESRYDCNCDEYVIFSSNCNVEKRIVARKEYYTNDSQCIFIQRKKNKGYTIIVDKRLLSHSCQEIVQLYELIKEYLNTLEGSTKS